MRPVPPAILPGQAWDLGHVDGDGPVADARYPTPALRSPVVAAAALILAAPATASEIFAVDAQDLTLQVNGSTALVSYTAKGNRRHLLVWGAINAPFGASRRRRRFGVITAAAGNRAAAPSGHASSMVQAIARAAAAVPHAACGAGRDALGCAGVAAAPADAWLRPMEAESGCDGIPSVALVWPGRIA